MKKSDIKLFAIEQIKQAGYKTENVKVLDCIINNDIIQSVLVQANNKKIIINRYERFFMEYEYDVHITYDNIKSLKE